MKVLLINPQINSINTRLPESLNRAEGVYPPLGLAYIGAVLEEGGHEVSILDMPALNLSLRQINEKMLQEKPDIVGITVMSPLIRNALEIARIAKEAGLTVVMGGPHLSAYPEETLSHDFVDYGITGEGEHSMLKLADALASGGAVDGIEGLVYKKDRRVCMNEPAIVEDLDSLPFPARYLLPAERYSSVIAMHPFTTMMSGRGCPFDCGFCFKQPSDKKIRRRSASNIVDEMEEVVEKYRVKEIMFYDDTFTLQRDHVVNICNEILDRGLDVKWEAPTRADCIDKELLKIMQKAGCIRLRYGVESGDEEILRLMRKGITIKLVKDVFEWTREAGIETFAYFIIGYAKENAQSIKRTISLAKELNPDWVMFTVAMPYPCTQLYEMAQKEGLLDGDYWAEITLGSRDERMPYLVADADEWVRKAYRSFYLRPSFVVKKLLKLRNLDTLRKYIRGMLGVIRFKV